MPTLHEDARTLLRIFVEGCESMDTAATRLDVSRQFLWMVLKGKKPVPERVLHLLGYHRVVKIERLGS